MIKLLQSKLLKIIFGIIVVIVVSVRACNSCATSSEKKTNAQQPQAQQSYENTSQVDLAQRNAIQESSKLAISNDNIFKPIIDSLLQRGVASEFIEKYVIRDNAKFDEKYVKINVTGFLRRADYSYATSDIAIRRSKAFFRDNATALIAAEKKYNVPREIIVSILWIETRLGSYLGKNHLPSVFFSTALVNEAEFIEVNNRVVAESDNTDSMKNVLRGRVKQRSENKAKWAIGELAAMYEIEKKYGIDFNQVNGSWAGAFGISQFLPSSFLHYAVDGNNDGKIDLFNIEDAIFSVANYLKEHKWGNTTEQKRKAIWRYNNSNAYVDAVLKLGELIKK